jgi:hypothetical protein
MAKKFVSGTSPKSQWASENAPICSCWAIPRLKPSTLGTATTGVQTMLTKAQKRKKGVKLRLLKGRLVRQLALSWWRCQEGRAKARSLALYHTGHAAHSTVFYSSAGRRGPFPPAGAAKGLRVSLAVTVKSSIFFALDTFLLPQVICGIDSGPGFDLYIYICILFLYSSVSHIPPRRARRSATIFATMLGRFGVLAGVCGWLVRDTRRGLRC